MPTKLPYPKNEKELLDWAQKLVRELSKPDLEVFALDQFSLAQRLPDPTKLGDGKVIFIKDATGGGVPAYSRGGVWRRFDTNGVVV